MAEELDRLGAVLAPRYSLEEEIGRGGMATVYRARDLKHDRLVALKVLRPEVSAVLGPERFHREIQTAAGLQHPHILPLYDSGEADGRLYYTMPLVEETLRDRLSREGRLAIEVAVRIGHEVALALGHAHHRGIVHRDIKPENILLGGGYALVADFGIARALSAPSATETRLTEPGLVVGTPEYMSPEQASGQGELDGRSDIYSLGSVVYEMLAAEVPYPGNNLRVIIAKRFTDPVPSVGRLRPAVPGYLDLTIMKSLALDPVDRFADAEEFGRALLPPTEVPPIPPQAAATRAVRTAPPNASIAVLPFANTSSDPENEYFSDGIADELLEALSRVPGLKVAARTSSFAFKGKSIDVRNVAEQLGVRTLLEGSVRRSGDRVRITAQLIDAFDGCSIWTERYDRDMSEIFSLQDEIAKAILTAIEPALQLQSNNDPPPPPSADPEAYELFLKGKYFVQHAYKTIPLAVKYLEEAVQRDPAFALAHAHLARAYMFAGTHHVIAPHDAFPRSWTAAVRALELDDRQPAIHATLGILSFMYKWDWPAAERHLRRASQLTGPNQVPSFGQALWLATVGRFDEALALSRRILDLDPASQKAHQEQVVLLTLARRFAEALEHCSMILERNPGSIEEYRWLGQIYEHLQRWPEALEAHRTALERSRRSPWAMMGLIRALRGVGLETEATACLMELTAEVNAGRVPGVTLATVYAAAGQADQSFTVLQRAFEAREPWLVFLKVDPTFDPIRDDPRFAAFVDRIGIPR